MAEVDSSLSALDTRLRHLEQLLGTAKLSSIPKDPLLHRVDIVRRDLANTLRERKYILEFLEKYETHAKTLDPAVSALAVEREVLAPEAKTEIILASEAELTQFAEDMKQIKTLELVIGGTELQGIAALVPQLAPIESVHIEQSAQGAELSVRVSQLLDKYNGVINTLSEIFISWDHMLASLEAHVLTLERRKLAND